MYQQVYDPVADSLGLTSLFAAIPLTLMFVMLGGSGAKRVWRIFGGKLARDEPGQAC
jgi:hypothetical protein